MSSLLFVYNDFEVGNDDVYMVGFFVEWLLFIKLRLFGGGNCKDVEGNDWNIGDDCCNGFDVFYYDFNLVIDWVK